MPRKKVDHEQVTISLPRGLSREAQDAGFNVSALCAQSIRIKLAIMKTHDMGQNLMKEYEEKK